MQDPDTTSAKTRDTAMAIFAVLFASGRPVSKYDIMLPLGMAEDEFKEALLALKDILSAHTPLELLEAEDTVALETDPEYGDVIKRILRLKRETLSHEATETLSIVAYKQPITRSQIEEIRGVDCEKVLATLCRLQLIKIAGSLDTSPGSPYVYMTTKEFLLKYRLKSLRDLPPLPKVLDSVSSS